MLCFVSNICGAQLAIQHIKTHHHAIVSELYTAESFTVSQGMTNYWHIGCVCVFFCENLSLCQTLYQHIAIRCIFFSGRLEWYILRTLAAASKQEGRIRGTSEQKPKTLRLDRQDHMAHQYCVAREFFSLDHALIHLVVFPHAVEAFLQTSADHS